MTHGPACLQVCFLMMQILSGSTSHKTRHRLAGQNNNLHRQTSTAAPTAHGLPILMAASRASQLGLGWSRLQTAQMPTAITQRMRVRAQMPSTMVQREHVCCYLGVN
jgi:hypothetical protein